MVKPASERLVAELVRLKSPLESTVPAKPNWLDPVPGILLKEPTKAMEPSAGPLSTKVNEPLPENPPNAPARVSPDFKVIVRLPRNCESSSPSTENMAPNNSALPLMPTRIPSASLISSISASVIVNPPSVISSTDARPVKGRYVPPGPTTGAVIRTVKAAESTTLSIERFAKNSSPPTRWIGSLLERS